MKAHRYRDRRDAGDALSAELQQVLGLRAGGGAEVRDGGMAGDGGAAVRGEPDAPVLVLALPRGGVPVADVVARALGGQLDLLVVRKIGVPAHPELAMGALALLAGTVETVRNPDVIAQIPGADSPGGAFDTVAETERAELLRRDEVYRQGLAPVEVTGRVVVVVDDGLATGATMRAALIAARRLAPARLVAAVPVGSSRILGELEEWADDVVAPWVADDLGSVGQAYQEFGQTSDDEVRRIMRTYPPG